jgi:hypothetical protein
MRSPRASSPMRRIAVAAVLGTASLLPAWRKPRPIFNAVNLGSSGVLFLMGGVLLLGRGHSKFRRH